MKIHETYDYDLFKIHPMNRKVSDYQVRILAKDVTFEKKFPSHPILVNKRYEIMDGQHRFYAAQVLNIPIYYIIDDDATIDDARRFNGQQNRWTRTDWMFSFCQEGKEDYIWYKEMMSKFKINFSPLMVLIAFFGSDGERILIKEFKNGKFKVDCKKDVELLLECLEEGFDKLRKSHVPKEYVQIVNSVYYHAFCKLFVSDTSMFHRLMKKLYLVYNSLPVCRTRESAYQALVKAAGRHIATREIS